MYLLWKLVIVAATVAIHGQGIQPAAAVGQVPPGRIDQDRCVCEQHCGCNDCNSTGDISEVQQLVSTLLSTQTTQSILLERVLTAIDEKLTRLESVIADLQDQSHHNCCCSSENGDQDDQGTQDLFYHCPTVQQYDDYTSMWAGGIWPRDGLCRMLRSYGDTGVPAGYTVSVELYNHQRPVGHPGVVYNARDEDNFDFIYFRPHSVSTCYQTGYVSGGTFHGATTGPCPNGPPRHQQWFTVELTVRPGQMTATLDGVQLPQFTPQWTGDPWPIVGVEMAFGYSNTIYYRNLGLTIP